MGTKSVLNGEARQVLLLFRQQVERVAAGVALMVLVRATANAPADFGSRKPALGRTGRGRVQGCLRDRLLPRESPGRA